MPRTKINAAATTTGWRRSNCLTRPDLRPTKMTFIRFVLPTPSSCFKPVHYILRKIETMPRAVPVDYAENSLKTRISARFSNVSYRLQSVLQCKILGVSVTYCHDLETN